MALIWRRRLSWTRCRKSCGSLAKSYSNKQKKECRQIEMWMFCHMTDYDTRVARQHVTAMTYILRLLIRQSDRVIATGIRIVARSLIWSELNQQLARLLVFFGQPLPNENHIAVKSDARDLISFGWLIINNVLPTISLPKNKKIRFFFFFSYFFVETGGFDAFHQPIDIVDHFQHPTLIVAFLQRVVTDLS